MIIWPWKEQEKIAKMSPKKRKPNWTKFMMTNIKRNYSLPPRSVYFFDQGFMSTIFSFGKKSNLYFSPINLKSTSKICWTIFTDGIGKFEKEKNVELSKQTISKVRWRRHPQNLETIFWNWIRNFLSVINLSAVLSTFRTLDYRTLIHLVFIPLS